MLLKQRRGLLAAALMLSAAGLLGALVSLPATAGGVQQVDDAVLRWASALHTRSLAALARAFDIAGGAWVTWPLRVVALVLLAGQRRWLQLCAFGLAVISSELLIGALKAGFARPRPPASLIETSGFSFPSGHAVATAVTAVGLVVVLLPPGRRRWAWEVRALAFTFVMALSRVYLRAHWLSDVVAGALLGAGLALGWPALLQTLFRRPAGAGASPVPAEEVP